MPIHIIIDGYNLIRRSHTFSPIDQLDLQQGREALIDFLAAYKKVKAHNITIVFDAANSPIFSDRRNRLKGINIRFSKPGELADAVIKRMAKKESQQVLVVSSDQEIVRYCESVGASTIGVAEFEEKLMLAVQMENKGTFEDDEYEGWKPTTRKKGPRRRFSKKKRKNIKKIRKL